jgi:hypothetical protein
VEEIDMVTPPPLEAQPVGLDSAVLARLIEEVRNELADVGRAYDRVHNRHNR